MYKNKEMWE